MRIALISYEYPPETGFGGIGTYTYYHAHALARLGHEVHVFAGTTSAQRRSYRDGNVRVTRWRSVGIVERLVPAADRLGLHWAKNRLQNAANSLAALRRELVRGRFDVVEMPECGGEGAFVNHLLGLPTVVRLHSPSELIMPTYPTKASDRMLTAIVERLGLSGARVVTSCSHWLANEVRVRMGIDRPISVIPNGIDLALFDQDEGIDASSRFGVPRDRLRIFFANRLEERKGIHVVRDLLAPVLQQHPDAVFVLAGADPSGIVARELQPMLAERGLQGGLVHVGKLTLPEVRACLKQTDIFLLPSIWENAPYSLLEAMSAGKAIVASDCGGVPEILRNDVDGLIARTGDAQSFARALNRMLGDANLRLRLGQSARARVEARFTDEHVARRSLELYEWALGAPAALRTAGGQQAQVVLGPENWFQAWWLRHGSPMERPAVDPGFAEVGLAELDFAHVLSARLYWSGSGRGGVAESDYLDDLATMHRLRAMKARDTGQEPASPRRLSLPALTHPIFADDPTAGAFLDELWRLGDLPSVAEWLLREIGSADFVDRATRRVLFRRLALEALRRRPGEQTLAVLRRIYRSVGWASRVVQQDLDFLANDPKGPELAALVREHGLHAPMQRPAVFAKPRRRKPPGKAPAADVTVLIPSFRHEAYVVKAIESALAQSHRALRVLVVDDASPDGTLAAARSIADPRVSARANERNLGLGASIRAALAEIATPYVALLNSDDVFHPERLERCLAALAAEPAAAVVATRIAVMDEHERKLTAETSCVLDVGGPAHGWVRWYERVTAALAQADWTSLPALLQHNHLATSSNIVCRTSFLAEQAAAFAPLKYCLDWQIFLRAAVAGSLRFVDEPLLGYRLHGANTVWFADEARPGYVHEVNAVVADALRRHAEARRREGRPAAAIAEELAMLVRHHVSQHGETDGAALYLAEAMAGDDVVPAAIRSPELAAMANAALAAKHAPGASGADAAAARVARHAIEALARRNQRIEPEVGRLAAELASARADRLDGEALRHAAHAADAQAVAAAAEAAAEREQRAELAKALDETRARLVAATAQLDDERARLAATTAGLAATAAERDRVDAARAELASALDDARARLAATTAGLAATAAERDRLDAARVELASALDDARARLAATAAGRAAAEAEVATTKVELARTIAELKRTAAARDERRNAVDRLHGELAAAQGLLAERQKAIAEAARAQRALAAEKEAVAAALARLQTQHAGLADELRRRTDELQRRTDELRDVERELRRAHEQAAREREAAQQAAAAAAQDHERQVADAALWAGRALLAERSRRRQLADGVEQRFGRFCLRKLGLGGPLRLGMRAVALAETVAERFFGGLRKSVPGRKPARAVLVWDGPYPDVESAPAATLAAAFGESGIDVRVACAGRASLHPLTADLVPAIDDRLLVATDRLLQRRDRKWWQRRNAEALRQVLAFPAPPAAPERACTLARTARAASAVYLHGFGLGGSGFLAHAASALAGLPFGVTLTRDDLPRLAEAPWRDLVARAAAIFVDSEALAVAVRRTAELPLPALLVATALPFDVAVAQPTAPARIACIGPFSDGAGLLTFAGAIRRIADTGAPVQVELLGVEAGGANNHVAVDWFRSRLAALGLADSLLLQADAAPATVRRSLAEAAIVFDPRTGTAADPAGISAGGVAALAAARPLVGYAEGLGGDVRDGHGAVLVARGDEAGLAAALLRLLGDAPLRDEIGRAGRGCLHRRFARGLAAAEAVARVRALRNALRG